MHTMLEHNLELMESSDKYGMRYQLGFESMGGNAGFYKSQSCAAANFRYDPSSGRILSFENYCVGGAKRFNGVLQGSYILAIPTISDLQDHGIIQVYLERDVFSNLLMQCAKSYNALHTQNRDEPKMIIKENVKKIKR